MARRALRKIDPSLDLSDYYRELDDGSPRFDLGDFLGRAAPLEVEVGSGKGLFLQNAAQALPARNILGIEVSKRYARHAAAGLARRGLANGKMLCGDALAVFRDLLPDESAAAVHVYFPDPWWKKRHRKRRVMQPEFVRNVQRVLQPLGRLHFWTDVEEYFHATRELILTATRLEGPFEVTELTAEHDLDYRTHFERRMRQHGLPVYRAEFRRA